MDSNKDIHIQQGYSYTAKVPIGESYRHFLLVFVMFYAMQLVTPRDAAMAVKIDSTI